MDDEKRKLRDEYRRLTGKNANGFWNTGKLQKAIGELMLPPGITQVKSGSVYSMPIPEKITADDSVIPKQEELGAAPEPATRSRWQELPPPIVEHLKQTFGAWLNYFEVGQEYKRDFGGYGMYIKVPREFSTEWHEETRVVYDNLRRGPKLDSEGREVTQKIVTEDVRWKSLKDIPDAIRWISTVKEHVIRNAYNKGIQLPNTNAPMDETRQTMDDFKKSLHRS